MKSLGLKAKAFLFSIMVNRNNKAYLKEGMPTNEPKPNEPMNR